MEIAKSYTLKGASITKSKVKQIMEEMKPSAITTGITSMSITPSGGVHSSGKQTWSPAVIFEFPISRSYVVIILYGYPKGIIMHVFLPLGKTLSEFNQTTLSNMIKKIQDTAVNDTESDDSGFVKHDTFQV